MVENDRKQRSIQTITESVPAYALGIDIHLRNMQQELYEAMSHDAGPLDLLWYGAGAGDILPVQMAHVVAIVERVPLLSRQDETSDIITRSVSSSRKPRLRQLLSGTNRIPTREAIERKIDESKDMLDLVIRRYIGDGLKSSLGEDKENIVEVLAYLQVLGIALPDVRLRKIPEGYHISFDLDGQHKHVFYFTTALPDMYDPTVSQEERNKVIAKLDKAVRGRVSIIGRVGIMKKADDQHVADNFFRLKPDVMVFDSRNSVPLDFRELYGDAYELRPFSGDNHFGNLRMYGYSSPEEGIHPIFAFRRT